MGNVLATQRFLKVKYKYEYKVKFKYQGQKVLKVIFMRRSYILELLYTDTQRLKYIVITLRERSEINILSTLFMTVLRNVS